jgi:hypothetical protein
MQPLRVLAAATIAALSFCAHAVGYLADITIRDRVSNRELPVHWHDGKAYVVGQPGNEYEVALRNRAGEDLLAVVSVDGVNVLSGETAHTRQGGYVMSRGERTSIRGWRKSLDEIAAFYFTSLGDSYAARTGRPANVGVIGVALFKRKYDEPLPPPAAQVAPAPASPALREKSSGAESRSNADQAPLGTGHGRRESSRIQWTQFERATDEPAEIVAIHYDSYRNLVAMGVLQAPVARRDPQPFPGFVPDPR